MNIRPAATVLLIWTALAAAIGIAAADEVTFTAAERRMILSHGPWPAATKPDPSNRFSAVHEAVAAGRILFSDKRLSLKQDLSCASCHAPQSSFTERKPRSIGTGRVDRNAIALANLRLNRWFGWDGKSDTLWAQSIHPIVNALEMNASAEVVADRITANPDLQSLYRETFGTSAADEKQLDVLVNIAKALSAYQETLTTPRTRFDAFRDALALDDAKAIARYPSSAKRGLKIFVGRGKCSFCHFGANFTNGEFHNIGLPHFADPGRVDQGRYGGIVMLRKSPFTRTGAFSDEPARDASRAPVNYLALNHRNWGEFRVPSLRNVANTAPYMHNGSKQELEDVVRHYSELDLERLHTDGESILQPLNLSNQEITDLVAFLETLTGNPAR